MKVICRIKTIWLSLKHFTETERQICGECEENKKWDDWLIYAIEVGRESLERSKK